MNLSDAQHPEGAVLPFQQHELYGRAQRYLGQKTFSFSIRSPGGRAGFAMLSAGRVPWFQGSPRLTRGPIWVGNQSLSDRINAMRELGRTGLKVVEAEDPFDGPALAEAGFVRVGAPREVAELDLSAGIEVLRDGLSRSWLEELRKSRERNLHMRHRQFDIARDGWVIEKGRGDPNLIRVVQALTVTDPTVVRYFSVEEAGEIKACFVAVIHGPVATALIAWADPAAAMTGCRHGVLWFGINRLVEQHFRRMDFWGLFKQDDFQSREFLEGAGVTVRQLGGTWRRRPWPFRLVS